MTLRAFTFGLLLLGAALPAQALRITPAHSGTWFDPAYDKQGFVIEVLGKAGAGPERIATVQWYTYDNSGRPVWAVGVGSTDGHVLDLTLQQASGGARPPVQLQASDLVDFAEVVITFGDCHTATAAFRMSAGGSSGLYHLQRLTQIGATHCTGGLGDEIDPRAEPLTLVEQMTATTAFAGAQGTVTFKSRPARASLEVEVRRLPAGTYKLRVGSVVRGEFPVAASGGGNGVTVGEIEFSSPEDDGDLLLDFDPQGQLIEVLGANNAVALSATLGPPAAP